MIRLYSGTPGSGKSLHNARDIIMRSKFGEPVIGNFECDLRTYKKANYTYCPNDKLTPEFLRDYSRKFFNGRRPGAKDEGSILLVIDECQLMFNSREWQRENRNQWLEFFTQHRKLGYDITLIAQFDRIYCMVLLLRWRFWRCNPPRCDECSDRNRNHCVRCAVCHVDPAVHETQIIHFCIGKSSLGLPGQLQTRDANPLLCQG